MEFYISNVQTRATEYTVMAAIADQVLPRSPDLFLADGTQPVLDLDVTLNPDDLGSVRDDGIGNISTIANGHQLELYPSERPVDGGLEQEPEQAPFIDPDIQQKIDARADGFVVSKVQIGTFYRPEYPEPHDPPAFSIEWEMDLMQPKLPRLKFESYHKQMRIEIEKESTSYSIVVKFDNIVKLTMPCDPREPYICFDLLTPPVFQKEEMHHPQDGNYSKKFRQRVSELNAGHGVVAPYAYQLRIVLYDDHDGSNILNTFYELCPMANIRRLIRYVTIDAKEEEFFSSIALEDVKMWLRTLGDNWRVAFQIEALLNNGIAHTRDVLKLKPRIDNLINRHERIAEEVMRYFVEAAVNRSTVQPLQKCLEAILQRQLRRRQFTVPKGRFFCHRVTLTPTRLLLEGPNIAQSNRVIRQFKGYEDHFLRVSFRDDDRQQYKCTRDIDGGTFLRERVGKALKEGLDLAERHFDFLAYSCSALKNHSVWFVSPFRHPDKGLVTAESIRASLGNFEAVIYSPSKYGARMAQAFTATDPSVKLHKSQWSEPSDIEQNGILFTDGVGTISRELANLIWQTLCENYPDNGVNAVQPSAYQIRFLGYKGMVVVDPFLEGIHMRLRPSMRKFNVEEKGLAEIEIASAFGEPKPAQLNRPLVTILEDRGVPIRAFLELQEKVVSNTRRADESVTMFTDLLKQNCLCEDFWVPDILRRLKSLGFELTPGHSQKQLDTPFLARLRSSAINYVLRGIKYRARIPIPDSYMLPGVADEGPAYVNMGYGNVYCLPEGKIFACAQNPGDKEPTWLKGPCVIYRSPVIHPGDVQCVEAIGEPPRNCLFAKLKNVVVFPAQGTRSLPNSLAGGDLDGDTYEVVQYGPLLDLKPQEPAAYPSATPYILDRRSTVDDVCNFIVEYINSDNAGLIADKHLVMADQLEDGTSNPACLKLAELHSQAVDYLKNGRKVSVDDIPRTPGLSAPDWHELEQVVQSTINKVDRVKSPRALGCLYRNIKLEKDRPRPSMQPGREETISDVLRPLVECKLRGYKPLTDQSWLDSVYTVYRGELKYISAAYSLSKTALSEEELVMGMILANSSSEAHKRERVFAMNESLSSLLRVTRESILGELQEVRWQLARAWKAWTYHTLDIQKTCNESGKPPFGSHSFGLIALGLVLKCLARMGSLPL
ncbi:RNA dependent RNA polymerase-domain-containing protein [Pisolithus marmoratus]|nr:RNA dependent RNA polymerase-domain-containing protein [Pisolithus marmoratus]